MISEIITTTHALAELCECARKDGLLALDTEFVWRQTYEPQLGIVQAGSRDTFGVVDCKTALDNTALGAAISDCNIVKILHDARQDLVHLRHYTGALPHAVFDTQLAAAFAGWPSGMGLQKLLFEALDVGLAKTETCTDWLKRPLSAAQVSYALDDVRYLAPLRDVLLEKARQLGTCEWMLADMARYDGEIFYADSEPNEMWKRIKMGRHHLDGLGRAILRAVAALREETARRLNLPRMWLGTDESLLQMASCGQVEHLSTRLRGGLADTLRASYVKCVDQAKSVPEEDWPEDPHPHYITEVKDAANLALEWLTARAEELHVDSAVIANRATVTAFIDNVDDESNPLASGWRYEHVGREMAEKFGVD